MTNAARTMLVLPRFYPIIDAAMLAKKGVAVAEFAGQLHAAGVRLVQYRDKEGSADRIAACAASMRTIFVEDDCLLILNDYPDLAAAGGWSGVHLGQQDASPDDARKILRAGSLIGVSTHNDEQMIAADAGCADYIAVGPVFATASKANAEPVIGLDGVRRLRSLTRKPLVAIGGITRANCASVMDAGADMIAAISELLPSSGETTEKVAGDFLRLLR